MAEDCALFVPAPGLRTDLETMLSLFTDTNSVRYAEFARIWRSLKFNTVFCGWGTEAGLRQMIEGAFQLIVGYLSEDYTFQVHMGALYLMYAFYMTQPLDPRQKIRLTTSQWSRARQLLETIQSQKHLDAEFIYHKLHYQRAFYYVVKPLPYHIIQNKKTKSLEEKLQPRDDYELETSIQDVFPQALLDNVKLLDDRYKDLKSRVIEKESINEAEGLYTLKSDFVELLTKGIKHMENWKPGMPSFDPDVVTQAMPTSPQRQHGTMRRRLKEHAFERQGLVGRHIRHMVLDSDPEKEKFTTPGRPAKRRRSSAVSTAGSARPSTPDPANDDVMISMPLGFDDFGSETGSNRGDDDNDDTLEDKDGKEDAPSRSRTASSSSRGGKGKAKGSGKGAAGKKKK